MALHVISVVAVCTATATGRAVWACYDGLHNRPVVRVDAIAIPIGMDPCLEREKDGGGMDGGGMDGGGMD